MTELAPPRPLKNAVMVRYEDGNKEHWIFCGACDLKAIVNPKAKMHTPTQCLHLLGAIVENRTDTPLQPVEIVVPCCYVTYIGLGPEIEISRDGERKIVWIMPTALGPARPDAVMSVPKIVATLGELADFQPEQPSQS